MFARASSLSSRPLQRDLVRRSQRGRECGGRSSAATVPRQRGFQAPFELLQNPLSQPCSRSDSLSLPAALFLRARHRRQVGDRTLRPRADGLFAGRTGSEEIGLRGGLSRIAASRRTVTQNSSNILRKKRVAERQIYRLKTKVLRSVVKLMRQIKAIIMRRANGRRKETSVLTRGVGDCDTFRRLANREASGQASERTRKPARARARSRARVANNRSLSE